MAQQLLSELNRLFDRAKKIDEFEFVNILIGYNGIGDQRALTHLYESRSYISDMKSKFAAVDNRHSKIRIGLHIYCHLFEMDELYNILGNLLRISTGQNLRYIIDLYNKSDESPLYPTEKFARLNTLAVECRFEILINELEKLYYNRIRNSFLHSAYSLIDDNFCIVKGDGIKIGNTTRQSVSIESFILPIIEQAIEFAEYFLELIHQHKSSYVANKIVTARMPAMQSVIILGSPSTGLKGFQTMDGAGIKIEPANGSDYFVHAMNISVQSSNNAVSDLHKKLSEYINGKIPHGREFNLVRDEVEATNDPKLKYNLAIAYYNWANDAIKTLGGKPPQQQRAIYNSVVERYNLAIKIDPSFGRPYHNLATTLLKKSTDDFTIDSNIRVEALKLFDETITRDPNMYEAWLNSGRVLMELGNIESDTQKQLKQFNESLIRLQKAKDIYPHDAQTYINLGWVHQRLGYLKHNVEENFKAAIYNAEMVMSIESNLDARLTLASMLQNLAEIAEESGQEYIDKAINILLEAEKLYGQSSVISYRLGNKYFTKWVSSEDINDLLLTMEAFHKAVEYDAANIEAINNLSNCEIIFSQHKTDNTEKRGLLGQAENRLLHVLDLDKTHVSAWYNLGVIYYEYAKKMDGTFNHDIINTSIEYFKTSEELEPGIASYYLARTSALKGDIDNAIYWLNTWRKENVNEMINFDEVQDFELLKGHPEFQKLVETI